MRQPTGKIKRNRWVAERHILPDAPLHRASAPREGANIATTRRYPMHWYVVRRAQHERLRRDLSISMYDEAVYVMYWEDTLLDVPFLDLQRLARATDSGPMPRNVDDTAIRDRREEPDGVPAVVLVCSLLLGQADWGE